MWSKAGMMSYGTGALIAIVASIGVLMVLMGSGILRAEPLSAVGVVLSVFGIYTIVYGVASKEGIYLVLWGGVALALGVGLAASNVLNPVLVAGIVLVFIAGVGAAAALRRRVT
ncbi:MAG: hypothetical protein NZ988_00010 [Thaumarchaeota archaeon]|nr:hypothetical protein [Candidatus Calditenuaceae archaeon]MDW8186426.1 hypothetical protein [Nitrososphaerota archaeon]